MPIAWPVPQAGPLDSTTGAQRDGIIFPSASRSNVTNSGVYNSAEYENSRARGLRLFLDCTVPNGGTVTVKLQVKDPASQNWVDVPGATTAALGSATTKILTVYPGQSETATDDISDPLGNHWRIVATVATAAVTFSVGGEYLG